MAVPKQRHNSSRGKRRRSGHGELKQKSSVLCKQCKKEIVPHVVCPYCGSYKGEQVIDTTKVAKSKSRSKK